MLHFQWCSCDVPIKLSASGSRAAASGFSDERRVPRTSLSSKSSSSYSSWANTADKSPWWDEVSLVSPTTCNQHLCFHVSSAADSQMHWFCTIYPRPSSQAVVFLKVSELHQGMKMKWSGRPLSLTGSSVAVEFVYFCNSSFFSHEFLPARKLERQLLVRVMPYSFKRNNCCENFPLVLILVKTQEEVQHLNVQSLQEIAVKKRGKLPGEIKKPCWNHTGCLSRWLWNTAEFYPI